MEITKLYNEAAIECIAGSTVTGLNIGVSSDEEISGYTMTCYVSSCYAPSTVIHTLTCTATEEGFTVEIPASDTKSMSGMYYLDFVLESGTTKIAGLRVLLNVRKSAVS